MNVDTQTPPGQKPPAPGSTPDPEKPWISPRLRAKLDDTEPDTEREGPSPMIGIVLAVLVVGGGAALLFTMQSGAAKQKVEAQRRAEAAAVAAAAESTANAARIDSMRAAARAAADSMAKLPGAKPAASAAKPPAPSKAAGAAAAAATPAQSAPATPVEKGPFGLDVGTFLAEERATSELARISTATGLKGKVVTRNEDGGEVYHVVLGSFPSRSAADKRAEALVGKALVEQAQTVPLNP